MMKISEREVDRVDSERRLECRTPGNGMSHVACLGAGLIGSSWIALFLAAGKSVAVHDPDPASGRRVRETVEQLWPLLRQLGLTEVAAPTGTLTFHVDARVAVAGADFVQESIPERLGWKHALYQSLLPSLRDDVIVASSSFGLTLTELQAGWHDPSRFILGHSSNLPHLASRVEMTGNELTAAGVLECARAFYESVGKATIKRHCEPSGRAPNRLLATI